MKQIFTIGELAEAATGGNERAMRKLLNDAGARVDENISDPAEAVPRDQVVALLAMRAGDRVGRKLAEALRDSDDDYGTMSAGGETQ